MTKTIITETNQFNRSGFAVVTNIRTVDDPGIRMTPRIMLSRKLKERYKIEKLRDKSFKLIQYYQLLALKSDDHIEVRQALEYVEMILVPELRRHERDIVALTKQIEKLRAQV